LTDLFILPTTTNKLNRVQILT